MGLIGTGLELTLSRGETRVVYMPPRALVLGIKGHATVVEHVNNMGGADFSICIPLRAGEQHEITYGGTVMLRAAQSSALRIIEPQAMASMWLRRWAGRFRAVLRAAGQSRRAYGRA